MGVNTRPKKVTPIIPKNTAVPVAEIGVGKDRDTQDSLYALAWGEEAEEN